MCLNPRRGRFILFIPFGGMDEWTIFTPGFFFNKISFFNDHPRTLELIFHSITNTSRLLTSLLGSHLSTANGVLRAANPLLGGVLLLADELLLRGRRLLLQRVRRERRLIGVHFDGLVWDNLIFFSIGTLSCVM